MQNFQQELNRLKASLGGQPAPGATPKTPNQAPVPGGVHNALGHPGAFQPPATGAVGAAGTPSIMDTLKKYGKFIILGIIVLIVAIWFIKKKKAASGGDGKNPKKKSFLSNLTAALGGGGGGAPKHRAPSLPDSNTRVPRVPLTPDGEPPRNTPTVRSVRQPPLSQPLQRGPPAERPDPNFTPL